MILTSRQIKILKNIKEGISPVLRDRWKEEGYKRSILWFLNNGWLEKKDGKNVLTDKSLEFLKTEQKMEKKVKSSSYKWVGVPDKYNKGRNKVVHCVDKNGKSLCLGTYDVDDDDLFKKLPKCKACKLKFMKLYFTE